MMSSATKLKLSIVAVAVVLLLRGGLFWYFRVHTKTPTYALHAVEQALDTRDEGLFLRYVRLDAVLDSGYDDFMAGTMEVQFGPAHEAPAGLDDFAKMLKPAFIKMVRDAVETRLTTGEWPSADPADEGAI